MEDLRIHPDDDMFTGNFSHYEACGKQFAEIIAGAVAMTDKPVPRILELPCGYGRVTRHLVTLFGPGQIEVADIMAPCIDFCASEFDVKASQVIPPVNEFANLPNGQYDVAAMGSLITHLSEENTRTVIRCFLGKLAPGGTAVVTTHGECSKGALEARTWFEVSEAGRAELLDAYNQRGHGFVNYAPSHFFEKKTAECVGDAYGVSLTHKDWMYSAIEDFGYSVTKFIQGGWDNHQDVYFIRR